MQHIASVPLAPHQAQPQPAHLMSLPACDDRPPASSHSPLVTLPKSQQCEQPGEPAPHSITGWDGSGSPSRCSGMAQQKMVGSTSLRSCSCLLALRHPDVSGRDASCPCRLSTSKVSPLAASQCKWVSGCCSSCPGIQSSSMEEKQEEPFGSSGGRLGRLMKRQAVNQNPGSVW